MEQTNSTHEGDDLVQKMVLFTGKDLHLTESVFGTMRRPPQKPIRIGVCQEGLFKVDSTEDKIIHRWAFDDIKDCNFSGYSFTLKLYSGGDYSVRTDDGQAISHWVESFSKNPQKATVAAKQFKSLGQTNTMRKFMAELKPVTNTPPKFYTLNTRRSHKGQGSRGLSVQGYSVSEKKNSLPLKAKDIQLLKDPMRWSTGVAPSSHHRREQALTSSFSTESEPSFPSQQQPKAKSMESLLDRGTDENGMSLHITLHSGSTHSNGVVPRANSVPPPSEQDLTSSGQSDDMTNSSSSENLGSDRRYVRESGLLTKPHSQSSPPLPPKPVNSHVVDEDQPTAPPRSASLPSNRQARIRGGGGGGGGNVGDDSGLVLVLDQDRPSLKPPSRRIHTYEEITFLENQSERESEYDHLPALDDEIEYDHLIPTKKGFRNAVRNKEGKMKARKSNSNEDQQFLNVHHSPVRRNESMPKLTSGEKPRIEVTMSNHSSELSDSDQERDPSPSPSPSACPGSPNVIFRNRSSPDRKSADPFEDLLKAPPSKSHLRWSQELNPLYDYVRGGKVSPVCGYEVPSSLSPALRPIKKTPSPIEEEESSLEESIGSTHRNSTTSQTDEVLQRCPRDYEEAMSSQQSPERVMSDREKRAGSAGSAGSRPRSELYQEIDDTLLSERAKRDGISQAATISSPLRRVKTDQTPHFASPRLGKRALPNQRSKTVLCVDDSNAPQHRQRPHFAGDTMKDFSYITREYRLFYIKMPNGQLLSEVVNINKPVMVLIERLCYLLGAPNADGFSILVEGAVLTTMREATLEFGEIQSAKAHTDRQVSLSQLVDSSSLADQGSTSILLKSSLSFRMQGITTSRILRLDDPPSNPYLAHCEVSPGTEFHQRWLGICQGNQPCSLDDAVKLAAMQYQAYFLERTAEHSVVGFCRPTEFLPAEYAGVRGIEQRMYKEQEKLKSRSQKDIQQRYVNMCSALKTGNTVFFPAREPRRRLLQNTKLKPVLLGVSRKGITRVCCKTKEVLDFWDYQVLKNWAYSRKTFVLAFNNRNYPVESNQARWISELVDFFVESIVSTNDSKSLSPTSSSP